MLRSANIVVYPFNVLMWLAQRDEEEEYEVDDDMALALGFGGFGSSKR